MRNVLRSMVVVVVVALVAACSSGDGSEDSSSNPSTTTEAGSTSTTASTTTGLGDATSEDPDDVEGADLETATRTPDEELLDAIEVASVEWGPCDDAEDFETIECGEVVVPLDHTDPEGETITLGLLRVPASTDEAVGSILVNPGGPGGSGIEAVRFTGLELQTDLGVEDHHVVGFDPRGVGESNGLRCLSDAELDEFLYLDTTPDDEDGEAALEAADAAFLEGCRDAYGDTLRHYSTLATARDLELLRRAVGDERLTYVGFSYGTYLGAVYAARFPGRVGALVLDSAFEPTDDTAEQFVLGGLEAREQVFRRWIEDCEADPGCPFTAPDVAERWSDLRDALDEEPVPAADGRPVNDEVLDVATLASLYDEVSWGLLSSGLADAEAGDGSGLLALADLYNERDPDGSYSSSVAAINVISCASGYLPDPPEDLEAFLEEARRVAPTVLGDIDVEEALADELAGVDDGADDCVELVGEVEPVALGFEGSAPVLVIGGRNDPATPFRWAEEMVAVMGSDVGLVAWEGEGHAQLLASTCLAELAGATLRTGEVPDETVTCEPDPPKEAPDWWDEVPVPAALSEPDTTLGPLLGLDPAELHGEVRTTTLSPREVLDTYAEALEDTDLQFAGETEIEDDFLQGAWLASFQEGFLVNAIAADVLAEDLGVLADLVEPGTTVVILIAAEL